MKKDKREKTFMCIKYIYIVCQPVVNGDTHLVLRPILVDHTPQLHHHAVVLLQPSCILHIKQRRTQKICIINSTPSRCTPSSTFLTQPQFTNHKHRWDKFSHPYFFLIKKNCTHNYVGDALLSRIFNPIKFPYKKNVHYTSLF